MVWARETAGYTLDEAAGALGIAANSLTEIEGGQRAPSRAQLLKMVKKYRRPLLAFYLSEPPPAASKTHDFRTTVDGDPSTESMVDALVRDVRVRQMLVVSALEEADQVEDLGFVGSLRGEERPDVIAAAMYELLGFDLDEYRAHRFFDDAFSALRKAVESIGVYVLLKGDLGHHSSKISPKVFRGIALADEVAPFIVINEYDSRVAWSFTLLHELAHVLIGESGISGYDSDNAIERICDEAAASFLLQPDEIEHIPVDGIEFDELIRNVSEFAAGRHVSRKMAAYNLLKAGRITAGLYREISDRLDKDREQAAAAAKKKRADAQIDYYIVRRHRVGPGLTNLVGRMVSEGVLTSIKAARVLGVKPTAVDRMTVNERAV